MSAPVDERFGGAIWDLKAAPGVVDDGEITVWIRRQNTPLRPFTGNTFQTPWNVMQLAHFTGYAMWTDLAEPLNLTFPGVIAAEGLNWMEDGKHGDDST